MEVNFIKTLWALYLYIKMLVDKTRRNSLWWAVVNWPGNWPGRRWSPWCHPIQVKDKGLISTTEKWRTKMKNDFHYRKYMINEKLWSLEMCYCGIQPYLDSSVARLGLRHEQQVLSRKTIRFWIKNDPNLHGESMTQSIF